MYLFVYVIYIDVHTFVSELLGGSPYYTSGTRRLEGGGNPKSSVREPSRRQGKAVLKGNPTWPAPYIFDGLK